MELALGSRGRKYGESEKLLGLSAFTFQKNITFCCFFHLCPLYCCPGVLEPVDHVVDIKRLLSTAGVEAVENGDILLHLVEKVLCNETG